MLACSATCILEILPLVNRIHVCPPQVPDYDESIIQRAVQALASKQLGEYAHRQRLEALAAGGWSIRGLACWGGRLLLVPPACVLV